MCSVPSAVEAAGRDVAAHGGRLQPGTGLLRVYQHNSGMMSLPEMCLRKAAAQTSACRCQKLHLIFFKKNVSVISKLQSSLLNLGCLESLIN